MDRASLIDLIAAENHYLIPAKRSARVLDAMQRVDRKQFIPEGIETITEVNGQAKKELEESLKAISQKPATLEAIKEIVMKACKVDASARVLRVPRKELAYNDEVLEIGYGQTCSQPSMVAFMAEALELKEGMKVLEIGTGCGYHAAVTAELVGERGKVYSMECIPELAELAHGNLRQHFGAEYQERVTIITGDGSSGLPEKAPFEVIYLTAGVNLSCFNPSILAQQLKLPGGILLYPEQEGQLILERYGKFGNIEEKRAYGQVSFVPLRGKNAEVEPEIPALKVAQ